MTMASRAFAAMLKTGPALTPDVAVDRDVILAEAVVNVAAVCVVEMGLLMEREADAPGQAIGNGARVY